ncbi:type II CAAX endopeptidase family protein [Desulfobacula sp.]|uniref:CPBP family intramembrane glutamic endopeptidase n=1 Tax=Desulfobacula sp. TaxID=2593537 RepID=UPI002601F51D|nr:type II CAAX endopeptidase family protein [Desulfobacula sp.]
MKTTDLFYNNTVPWTVKDLIFFSNILIIYMVGGGWLIKTYLPMIPLNIRYYVFILVDIFSLIICFGILNVILKKYANGWRSLLSGKDVFFTNLVPSIGIAAVTGLAMLLIDHYVSPFLFRGLLSKPVPYTFSLFIVYPIIIAPVTEEIWFRSFFYRGIKKECGLPTGLIVSTFLFVLYHYYNFSSISIIIYSIFITLYYEKNKNLYNCILIHSIINLINITGRLLLL